MSDAAQRRSTASRRTAANPRRRAARSTDEAYQELREAIYRGELMPNERLIEVELAARLQVSRGVVRTALVRLGQDGPQLVRFQYRTILVPGRPAQSLGEHAAIVEAIANRDPDLAEAAMRRHLGHVESTLANTTTAIRCRFGPPDGIRTA